MEDYRSQALRMLVRWGEEMERLEVKGQHPLQTMRELPGRKREYKKSRPLSARATESKRQRPQKIPIRELSGEAQRIHRILNFIRDDEPKAFRALELMGYGIKHKDACAALNMNEHDHRAAIMVGIAVIVAMLKVKAF